jgi:copper chaperone CopZ
MFRLDVPHMKSDQCRVTIMGALMGVDPRAQCDVDVPAKRVAVESTFPPSDFVEALEEVGYSSFIAQV